MSDIADEIEALDRLENWSNDENFDETLYLHFLITGILPYLYDSIED